MRGTLERFLIPGKVIIDYSKQLTSLLYFGKVSRIEAIKWIDYLKTNYIQSS